MSRHILDKTEHAGSEQRASRFAQIDRDAAPRPQTKALQRRAQTRADGARATAYSRIERDG